MNRFQQESPMTSPRCSSLLARPHWPRLVIGSALLATLALAGCDRSPSPTVGDQVGSVVDKAADKMDAAGTSLEKSADQAQAKIGEAADTAAEAVKDSGITVAVKARLAADDDLRVLQIEVETHAGRTALRGTAPSAVARDRATQIAGAVDGVVSVDNQLTLTN
jgi:hyperosmotically inducible periplasmic protein